MDEIPDYCNHRSFYIRKIVTFPKDPKNNRPRSIGIFTYIPLIA